MITMEKVKPGICPICGNPTGRNPVMVQINLNDGAIMPQPVCWNHVKEMQDITTQNQLLAVCKKIWTSEILSNNDRNEDDKVIEINRIKALQAI